MFVSLLFAVAVIGDNPSQIVPPPPPPPPVVITVAAPQPVPTVVAIPAPTVDGEPCGDCQTADDAVSVPVEDGHLMTTGAVELRRIEEATARGETDEEYGARLYAQWCAAKPWMCEG